MRFLRTSLQQVIRVTVAAWLSSTIAGCQSSPLESDAAPAQMSSCSAALRQALGLVDAASESEVSVLEGEQGSELVVFVDASAGGINGQDAYPWVYVSLASGTPVGLTDIEALASDDWDLAFKRFVVRTNSGDGGPGKGGALRVELPWKSVTLDTLGTRSLPAEDWFDDDCNLTIDEQGELVTTFAGWHEYDLATHTLMPAPVVYLVRGAAGALYKLAILDYYASPSSGPGTVPGRYKLRIAPLK